MYLPVCNLERGVERGGNGRERSKKTVGMRGGLEELVWWGKEWTDVGKGEVRRIIRTFARIFGFLLASTKNHKSKLLKYINLINYNITKNYGGGIETLCENVITLRLIVLKLFQKNDDTLVLKWLVVQLRLVQLFGHN